MYRIMCSICVAIMFVQATKSRRQNKTYVSYLVRESFRTSEGPRSRTVCNISALPPEVRDLVAAALSGQTCVVLEQIELSQALDYGGLAVLRDAWQLAVRVFWGRGARHSYHSGSTIPSKASTLSAYRSVPGIVTALEAGCVGPGFSGVAEGWRGGLWRNSRARRAFLVLCSDSCSKLRISSTAWKIRTSSTRA